MPCHDFFFFCCFSSSLPLSSEMSLKAHYGHLSQGPCLNNTELPDVECRPKFTTLPTSTLLNAKHPFTEHFVIRLGFLALPDGQLCSSSRQQRQALHLASWPSLALRECGAQGYIQITFTLKGKNKTYYSLGLFPSILTWHVIVGNMLKPHTVLLHPVRT